MHLPLSPWPWSVPLQDLSCMMHEAYSRTHQRCLSEHFLRSSLDSFCTLHISVLASLWPPSPIRPPLNLGITSRNEEVARYHDLIRESSPCAIFKSRVMYASTHAHALLKIRWRLLATLFSSTMTNSQHTFSIFLAVCATLHRLCTGPDFIPSFAVNVDLKCLECQLIDR